MDKVVASAAQAVADVHEGASFAVGGFGLSGVPNTLIQAVYDAGVGSLGVVSNNCGAMESGLAVLLGGPDRPGHGQLHRREQGVRPAVPRR